MDSAILLISLVIIICLIVATLRSGHNRKDCLFVAGVLFFELILILFLAWR